MVGGQPALGWSKLASARATGSLRIACHLPTGKSRLVHVLVAGFKEQEWKSGGTRGLLRNKLRTGTVSFFPYFGLPVLSHRLSCVSLCRHESLDCCNSTQAASEKIHLPVANWFVYF